MTSPVIPICPYCGKPARFMPSSEHIYHGRNFGGVWDCLDPCMAWVGANRTTGAPLGRLADAELRSLKIQTHAAFDPVWRNVLEAYPDVTVAPKKLLQVARGRAYRWLSVQMGIPQTECHIAAFGPEQCRQALEIITFQQPTAVSVRAWAKAQREVA